MKNIIKKKKECKKWIEEILEFSYIHKKSLKFFFGVSTDEELTLSLLERIMKLVSENPTIGEHILSLEYVIKIVKLCSDTSYEEVIGKLTDEEKESILFNYESQLDESYRKDIEEIHRENLMTNDFHINNPDYWVSNEFMEGY
jgi:hypothetical protein